MKKEKSFEEIARLFHVSNESAKYFLNHVQKSFKTERPPHSLIVSFIKEQALEFLLTPYETALLMKEKGACEDELVARPRTPEDEEDLYV